MTRSTLYILLPLSLLLSLALVGQGVVQTFNPDRTVSLLETSNNTVDAQSMGLAPSPAGEGSGEENQTGKSTKQILALGPAASQIAIKQLGTNGGGFFNVNSAHPFENPTPLSNFLEMLAILLIPAALCYSFGFMVGDTRQGWAILAAMTLVFVA